MTPRSLLAPARLAGQPILRSQTDERLVDLVRAGHEPAFEAIVARYRRPLLRYCSGILSGERAEDAVQQTFVKAYNAMRRDDSELNLRPWLYRIAHNTALNGLRDKAFGHEPLDPQLDGVERPDQAAERRQGVREVLAAVEALPARQRDAIVLRELEGRSYEEIAGALGVTGGAVRQLLSRARTTLRAAATAITPIGLLLRVPFAPAAPAADEVNGRVAEMVGGAGSTAVAAKLGATLLVTGAVAGGVAGIPAIRAHDSKHDPAAVERAADDPGVGSPSDDHGTRAGEPGDHRGGRGQGDGRRRHGGGRQREGERAHEHGRSGERRQESGGDRHGGRSDPVGGGGDRSGSGSGDHSGSGPGGLSGSGGDGGHSGSSSGDGSRSGPSDGTKTEPSGSSGPGPGSGSGSDGSTGGSGSGSGSDSTTGSGSGSNSGPGDPTRTDSRLDSGSSGPG